jgi:molybdate transport system regulatory protein
VSGAGSATEQSGEGRPGHHRARHNQSNPSHLRTPTVADLAATSDLHPEGRIWLQERGLRVFGPGAQELLRRVDETGSLNQAAKDMKMAYSKAWRMIGEIEQGLGVNLLERQTGGAVGGGSRLTTEGRVVLKRFDAFLHDVDGMLETLFRRHFSDLSYGAVPAGASGAAEGRRPADQEGSPRRGA